jgi:hypothetical protein
MEVSRWPPRWDRPFCRSLVSMLGAKAVCPRKGRGRGRRPTVLAVRRGGKGLDGERLECTFIHEKFKGRPAK